MPATLGAGQLGYDYDGEHVRVREVSTTNGTTYYAAPGFFEQLEVGDLKVLRHYVSSPEGQVAIVNVARDSSEAEISRTTSFVFQDHLGSAVAHLRADTGAVTRLGFDAWGKRRHANGADGTPDVSQLASERGFTGHEMLDELGLVHMNGRIYDPAIGRFLSADPIIQNPHDLQNYNRYSYVLNNPLSFSDPTGYSAWTKWRRPVLAIAVGWALGPAGIWAAQGGVIGAMGGVAAGAATTATMFASSVAAGFAAGGIQGGNLDSALTGALSAGLTFGLIEALNLPHSMPSVNAGNFGTHLARVAVHAASGCASASLAGGNCGRGAASAGFAEAIGPFLPGDAGSAMNFAAHAIAGGVASRAGGGSFQNGAFSAAFAYLFNELGSVMRAELRANRSWWKGFHEYDVWSPCPIANCTADELRAALSTMPALGKRVGNQTDIPGLGTVRHVEDSSGVLNITVEGQHRLSPGVVGRHVVTRDGVVGIQTYGVGWGILPATNERTAATFWQRVDQLLFDSVLTTRTGK